MKYYLCGPINSIGNEEENIEVFEEIAKVLRIMGYNIISPIELGISKSQPEYQDYIKRDLEGLLECDAIILLPGWPQSKGARGELSLAIYLNMKVFYCINSKPIQLVDMNF